MTEWNRARVAVHRRYAGPVPLEVLSLEHGARLSSEKAPLLVVFDGSWDRALWARSWDGEELAAPLAVSGPPALLRHGSSSVRFVAQAPSVLDEGSFLSWVEESLSGYGLAMPAVRRTRRLGRIWPEG